MITATGARRSTGAAGVAGPVKDRYFFFGRQTTMAWLRSIGTRSRR
jgi:hypothetical protein